MRRRWSLVASRRLTAVRRPIGDCGPCVTSDHRLTTNDRFSKFGFTLVEVVIALVILSIGLLATMTMFPVGLRAGRRATALTESALLAGRVLEEVRLAGYDRMIADPPAVPLSGEEGRYAYQVVLSEPTLDGVEPSAAVRRIDLTISWQEEGATRRETFVTYVSR